jgi:hypothetical protein
MGFSTSDVDDDAGSAARLVGCWAALWSCEPPQPTGITLTTIETSEKADVVFLGVTSDEVYWATLETKQAGFQTVLRGIKKTGGAPVVVQAFPEVSGSNLPPLAFATTNDAVYFAFDGKLMKSTRTERTPVEIATGLEDAQAILVEGSDVYFAASSFNAGGIIAKVSLADGARTILRSSPRIANVADLLFLDGDSIYWYGDDPDALGSPTDTIIRVPLAGSMMEQDVSRGAVYRYSVAGDWVYWISSTAIEGRRISDGTTVEVAARPVGVWWGLAADGDHVYVSDSGAEDHGTGTITAWPSSGGSARSVASYQRQPSAVTVDEKYVYWVNSGLTHLENGGDTLIFDGGAALMKAPK